MNKDDNKIHAELKGLLVRQLNHELRVAVQAAYFSTVSETMALKEHFLNLAQDELEHFSLVAGIINELGYHVELEQYRVELEKDELRALVIISAMEDTMIHLYEDIIPLANEPLKSTIRNQLKLENRHKKELEQLIKEVKDNVRKNKKQ